MLFLKLLLKNDQCISCKAFWVCSAVIMPSIPCLHPRLSVKQTRVLQLDEDVLCVRYSPNQKLLAVSLLDCTVKIFYTDTLKVTGSTFDV